MGAQPFCVRCGRVNDGSVAFIGPLCAECFLADKLLCIPAEVKIEYCRSCGSIRLGYRWVPTDGFSDAVAKAVKHALATPKPCKSEISNVTLVRATPLTSPSWRTRLKIIYRLSVKDVDVPLEYSVETHLRFVPSLCPACHMARGGDYNVVVQLRGSVNKGVYERVAAIIDSMPAIYENLIDVIEEPKGLDLLFRSAGAARRVVRELGKYYRLTTRYSSEVVGITSSGDVRRRLVLSVRLRGER